jgi:hypothetical protein
MLGRFSLASARPWLAFDSVAGNGPWRRVGRDCPEQDFSASATLP